MQQAVQQALLKVPQSFRSAVILRDLEGMSYEEVAEVLAVTVGTVKSRILRGRRCCGKFWIRCCGIRTAAISRWPRRTEEKRFCGLHAFFRGGRARIQPDGHNRLGALGQDG